MKKNEATASYSSGADFWNNIVESHGLDFAVKVSGEYLGTQLKSEQNDSEKLFCRELFTAMFEATAGTADPAKLVYPFEFQTANERGETSQYHESRHLNSLCAHAIDNAINDSCYETYYYNLELAAMKAVNDYGFARVNMVLAHNIQAHPFDGRLSSANKQWAKDFHLTEKAFTGAILNAHLTLLDDFARHTRELHKELDVDRFMMPGSAEDHMTYEGYDVLRAITFDDQSGFALGINPNAAQNFAVWQFTVENGKRIFSEVDFCDDFSDAAAAYIADTIVRLNDGRSEVTHKPPFIAETPELNESEQNFAAWMAVTESSRYKWVEDEIYRLNGRGAMYYTGGEDGVYMRISQDGKLEAGKYEGAIPHIGEAMFKPAVTKQFPNFSEAYKAAMEAGGKQFLVDMFSGSEPQPLIKMTGRGGPEEKPSVLQQIRDAQKDPQPPRKEKAPGKDKGGAEL